MKLTIGAAQMAPNDEDIQVNLERIVRMMETAKDQGVQVVAFPELALTPFFPVIYLRQFRHYFMEDNCEEITTIRNKAKELKLTTIFGYAEVDKGHYYNTAMVVDSNGAIAGKYRKVHIPAPMINNAMGNYEKIYFEPGNLGYPVIPADHVKIGLQICYDRHFPEGFRELALHDADIIFNLTATSSFASDWRSDTWKLMLRARAFENNVFVVGVNKTGIEYGKEYYGHCMIVSPLGGEILGFADTSQDDVLLTHTIDLEDRWEAHLRLPFKRDMMLT
ncbi:carbon-nitrogen hydrolase family protein [Paenibacillus sp. FSL W7-1287]|uniref:carbon-nitrogen hydrolase family protein n=1 Tax=Paenibacillus sp. FSL W7-1287 TaxID=2954538 RepID=UPI0030FAA63F